jgi:hypothetical protein
LLSEYAQLDSEGRYKVSMPFDFHNDDHPEGLASARVRMMQPYAGKGRGMQFPMAKGTEVLLTFVDGDPDRPLIAGAINTVAAPGPVTADNQTESVIQTGGNNKIRFEDEAGSERIIFESPKANSWFRIGTPNDPLGDLDGDGDAEIEYASDGIRINSLGSIWTEAVGKYGEYISGAPKNSNHLVDTNLVTDNTSAAAMLAYFNAASGNTSYMPSGLLKRFGPPEGEGEGLEDALNKAHIKVSSLDTFTTQEGNIYDFGGYWNYNLGNSYAEDHVDQSAQLNQNAKTYDDAETKKAEIDEYIHRYNKLNNDITEKRADYDDGGFGAGGSVVWELKELEESRTALLRQMIPYGISQVDADNTAVAYDKGQYSTNFKGLYTMGNMSSALRNITGSLTTLTSGEVQTMQDNKLVQHDLLDGAGPQWKSIIWPKPTGAKSGGPTIDLKGTHWTKNQDDYPTGGQVWVQKKWGHDYEYHVGDSISVSEGDTLNVVYGGKHTEAKYDGNGNIWSWTKGGEAKSWSSAGVLVSESKTFKAASGVTTDEKKYDYNTGDLYSHSMSMGTGMGMMKFDFDYSNTISMTTNTGSSLSMNSFLGGKMSIDNFVGAAINVSNAFGAILSTEIAPMSVKIDVNGVVSTFPGIKNELSATGMLAEASRIRTIGTALDTLASSINTSAVAIYTGPLAIS